MLTQSTLRWLGLVGVIWLQAISGTNLDFSAYSSQLKSLLSISQVQLNNLAFASDAGKLLGWLSGIALQYLPLWLVLLMGATLGLIGYGFQFLFLMNKIGSMPYWAMFLLCALAGNSICWINTVCYVVTIQNFGSARQIAVGTSTSYTGLSANIYASLVDILARSGDAITKAKLYLLFNAVVPMLASLLSSPLVRIVKLGESIDLQKEGNGLAVMLVITLATGFYSVFGSVSSRSSRFSSTLQAAGLGMFLVAPLAVPLAFAIRERLEKRYPSKKQMKVHDLNVGEDESRDVEVVVVKQGGEEFVEGLKEDFIMGNGSDEVGIGFLLKKLDFWLYYFVYMFSATLGIVFVNNLGQIAESRGLSKSSSLVSLSSSFGFFGRLLPSLLDYFLFTKNKDVVTKPALIGILMAPMAASFFLLINTSKFILYVSTATISICTGAVTSFAVSTTSDLFGAKNFSINHNIVVTNIPIGSFVFGYFSGFLYQRASDVGHGGACMGSRCYSITFLIWGSICSLGMLLSFALYVRTRKLYILENQQNN